MCGYRENETVNGGMQTSGQWGAREGAPGTVPDPGTAPTPLPQAENYSNIQNSHKIL